MNLHSHLASYIKSCTLIHFSEKQLCYPIKQVKKLKMLCTGEGTSIQVKAEYIPKPEGID